MAYITGVNAAGAVVYLSTTNDGTDNTVPAQAIHLAAGSMTRVTATFARPANTTAYTAGDVVSNDATTTAPMAFAALARLATGSLYITGAVLATDKKSIVPRIRCHVFTDNTATLAGDNLAYKEVYADASKGHRYFDLPAMITGTDTTNSDMSKAQDNGLRFPIICATASTTVYVVLEALDAFTPASGQNFSLTLFADTN